MDTKQAQQYLVETCLAVISTLATQHGIDKENLNIRIDIENINAKPVFAIFEKSNYLAPSTLKEIIHAGGGKGFTMLLGIHIKNIIKDIFKASMQRFETENSRDVFLLLFLKEENPSIAIFCNNEYKESLPIELIIASES